MGHMIARATIPWGAAPTMVTWVSAGRVLTLWDATDAAGRETTFARVDVGGDVTRVAICGPESRFKAPVSVFSSAMRRRQVNSSRAWKVSGWSQCG